MRSMTGISAVYRLAIDCETYLIGVGNQLPRVVCLQVYGLGIPARILRGDDARAVLAIALDDRTCVLTGHNVAFDLGCCALMWPSLSEAIFKAYERNGVICTMAHAQLADFAIGARGRSYALDKVCERWHISGCPDKGNAWRLRYGELDGVPTREWPTAAREYALADVKCTFDLSQKLQLEAPIPDVPAQSRWYYWLRLSSALGMATDPQAVVDWEKELLAKVSAIEPYLLRAGLIDSTGKKRMAFLRDRMNQSGNARRTPKTEKGGGGNVIVDALACEESGDPLLQSFARYNALRAAINRELPMVKAPIVHTFYGMAATTRTTSSNPNMQNLSTSSGSRKCFQPRAGMIYVIADYSILELCCLAEMCLALGVGDTLANVLIAGKDPHRSMAARLLGTDYDGAVEHSDYKRIRGRLAKEANYGFPGGMGPAGLQRVAAKRGTALTLAQATSLKRQWAQQWPEIPRYQKRVSDELERNNGGAVEHYRTRHIRGGLSYTQACNSFFQALGAVVTKTAGWALTRAGALPSLFIHDEYVIEAPIAEAQDWAIEIKRICESTAKDILEKVGCKCDPIINERWVK